MASAAFELAPDGATYGSSPQEVSSAGATVRCRLLSVAGVQPGTISWTCEGTNNPTVARLVATMSGSPNGQIATFTIPAGANQAYIIQCEVNGGPDVNGDASTRARGKFYVLNNAGRQPIAYFESTESNATHGTFALIDEINDTSGQNASAAGIGTIASPGILRNLPGGNGLLSLHVGGFWSLSDAGGGSFFWDSTSTATDDGGTIIRPNAAGIGPSDPGRWRRLYTGGLHVEWFGAKGDGSYVAGNTSGTNDSDAIQACIEAAIALGKSVAFGQKVYLLDKRTGFGVRDPVLDVSGSNGLVFDGTGGPKNAAGAWLKFKGVKTNALIAAHSTIGFGTKGIHFVGLECTRPASGDCDYAPANQAARLAGPYTYLDVGKMAFQVDTGARWMLNQLPGTNAGDWLPESCDIIDFRHGCQWEDSNQTGRLTSRVYTSTDVGKLNHQLDTGVVWILKQLPGTNVGDWEQGIGAHRRLRAYSAGDTNLADVKDSCFSGRTNNAVTYNITSGVRLANTIQSRVDHCQFTNLQAGVSATDGNYGGGQSNTNTIVKNLFQKVQRPIYNPLKTYAIRDNGFEPSQYPNASESTGIVVDIAGGLGLLVSGNIFADATAGGTCIDLSAGMSGASIHGNTASVGGGGTFLKCIGTDGIDSHGNSLTMSGGGVGYNFPSGTNTNPRIGPDAWSGGTYVSGTSFTHGTIVKDAATGGRSFGNGANTPSGTDSLCIGIGNTSSGNQSVAIGDGMVISGVDSLGVGARGTSPYPCSITIGGGTALGQGGAQVSIVPLNKVSAGIGATVDLLNASAATPGISGTNRHHYFLIAEVLAGDQGATPTKTFGGTLLVTARRTSAGTLTISGQTMLGYVDADGTGNTIAAVQSSNGISIQLTNNSGVLMNAFASIHVLEAAS